MTVGPFRWHIRSGTILCLAGAALVVCYGVLFAAPVTAAADQPPDVIFLPDWIGISGLLACAGMLIQWGAMKRQNAETDREILLLRNSVQLAMPRSEFEQRLNRMEDAFNERFDTMDKRFDALFRLLDLDRRHGSRAPTEDEK
jgi:hypothetical protein